MTWHADNRQVHAISLIHCRQFRMVLFEPLEIVVVRTVPVYSCTRLLLHMLKLN